MITLPWTKPKTGQWPLDTPIAFFENEPWTLQDALTGLAVVGATGSGKSSGPAAFFGRKLLEQGMGGIVLCYKTEEAAVWVKRMKAAGREKDACVFGLDSPYRFDFLDFESKQKSSGLDQIDNLSNMLLNIASVRRTAPVGNEASWWLPQKKALMRNCLSLLLLAGERLSLKAINALIQSAPRTVEEAKSQAWQSTSWMYSLLERAYQTNKDHPEFQLVEYYWLQLRAAIPEKTRVQTDAEYTAMVDGPLSRGRMAELFTGTTNIDPTACFDGKVIIIDLPVETYEEAGQYAALIWAVSFMRATQRRTYNPPNARPCFIFADEAQAFSTDHDANYFATCRSLGVCNIRMTQDVSGFVLSYGGGEQARLTVNHIFSNLCTKIFLRNDDPETNKWASNLIAKQTVYRPSMSSSSAGGISGLNTSLSQVEEAYCPEKTFLTLRNGTKKNAYTVEAVIFQAGRLWKGTQRCCIGEFKQEP